MYTNFILESESSCRELKFYQASVEVIKYVSTDFYCCLLYSRIFGVNEVPTVDNKKVFLLLCCKKFVNWKGTVSKFNARIYLQKAEVIIKIKVFVRTLMLNRFVL